MDHRELRELLKEHFDRFLSIRKGQIDREGPLSASDIQLLQTTVSIAKMELQDGAACPADLNKTTHEFIKLYGLDIADQTPKFDAFQRSILQAQRDFAQAALDYSTQAERFDYASNGNASEKVGTHNPLGMTLEQLVSEYLKVVKRESRWTPKTEGEREEHIALLYERLGQNIQIQAVGRPQANDMRAVLMPYPANRNKSPKTKNKTLDYVLSLDGTKKLHNRTINKYLHSYNGLFNWAVRSGHAAHNPFEGLSLRDDKSIKEAPRVAFSDKHIKIIIDRILDDTQEIYDHHKWGTLIAIYSGARLNEVCQLYLDDVRCIDDIWCIDINAKAGTRKKLKNSASQRIVPLHPKIIEYGFLSYLEDIKRQRGVERAFPQLTYSPSDGYGRNLGRWVNERLLPDLKLKTKQLTFHSFRHTVVRKLFNAQVPEPHVMAIVGHEPGTTTLKTYNRGGFSPKILLSAIEQVG